MKEEACWKLMAVFAWLAPAMFDHFFGDVIRAEVRRTLATAQEQTEAPR